MRKRLGKVAKRRAGGRVNLFGEQSHVIGVSAHALEHVAGLLSGSATERHVLGAPETADSERPLAAGLARAVAIEECVACAEPVPHAPIGRTHSVRVGVFEPIPRQQEQRRIHVIPVEPRRITSDDWIPSACLDFTADALAILLKSRDGSATHVPASVQLQQAIERRPAQDA